MTSYEFERALVYIAEQIIKTFGKDIGVQELKQKSAEPRIKNEKFCKAVRAWFNILPRLEDKRVLYKNGVFWVGVYKFDCGQYGLLDFWLESGKYYDIDELCGESE